MDKAIEGVHYKLYKGETHTNLFHIGENSTEEFLLAIPNHICDVVVKEFVEMSPYGISTGVSSARHLIKELTYVGKVTSQEEFDFWEKIGVPCIRVGRYSYDEPIIPSYVQLSSSEAIYPYQCSYTRQLSQYLSQGIKISPQDILKAIEKGLSALVADMRYHAIVFEMRQLDDKLASLRAELKTLEH